jgi:L-ascorbate metabolism protein UlaG (beta-lactamase superfamily)
MTLGACRTLPPVEVPPNDHFDGQRFHNAEPFEKGFLDLLRYYWQREPGVWQHDLTLPPGAPPPQRMGEGALRVTVVNHATVLIQADGLNVLTDPIWSERASPLSWVGPRRYVPPGLRFEELPKIDVVLISHNHYDHLDVPTLQRLQAAHDPMFYVGLGESATLRDAGLQRITELDWGNVVRLPNGRQLHGEPSVHWTGRGLGDRNRTLWLSYVLETAGGPVYFAGDTGWGPQFAASRRRHGRMRLALLPIGAYEPRWLTAEQHLDPWQAVAAHQALEAKVSIAIHFGTFELSEEGQLEPVRALAEARSEAGLSEAAFIAPEFGAGYDLAPISPEETPP